MGSKLFAFFVTLFCASVAAANADSSVQTSSSSNTKISHINDFVAHYKIMHEADVVGSAKRTLINHSDGRVEFSYETDIEWLIFSDQRQEVTENRIEQGQVIPLRYRAKRKGTGKDKHYQWSFDKANAKVTNERSNKTIRIDWPPGLQSKLSYHLQSRLNLINKVNDFTFQTLTTSGKIKSYQYQYLGEEQITLPYGTINAVKLKREKSDTQITYVWFAPELNYLMVKLQQIDGSYKQVRAELLSVASPEKKHQLIPQKPGK